MTVPISALVEEFEIEQNCCDARPSYNISPGREIAAIVIGGKKKLVKFKWGLVPNWAKNPAIGNKITDL